MAVHLCSGGRDWLIDCSDGTANTPCLSLKTLWQEVLCQMELGARYGGGMGPESLQLLCTQL